MEATRRTSKPATKQRFALFVLSLFLCNDAGGAGAARKRGRRTIGQMIKHQDGDYTCFDGCPRASYCSFNAINDRDSSVCSPCPLNCSQSPFANDQRATDDCHKRCDVLARGAGEVCSQKRRCRGHNESLFCNYSDGEEGVCQVCNDVDCDSIVSQRGQASCRELCDPIPKCYPVLNVSANETIINEPIRGTPTLSASGTLVNCTSLTTPNDYDDKCQRAEGMICLVQVHGRMQVSLEKLVQMCQERGGAGIVLYEGPFVSLLDGRPMLGRRIRFNATQIPATRVSLQDGQKLEQSYLGEMLQMTVDPNFGYCQPEVSCSNDNPCLNDDSTADTEDEKVCVLGVCREREWALYNALFAVEGEACSMRGRDVCAPGRFFCNDETCEACKADLTECLKLATPAAQQRCLECDLKCSPLFQLEFTNEAMQVENRALMGTPGVSVSQATLTDCSSLVSDETARATPCGGNHSVCLFPLPDDSVRLYGTLRYPYIDLVRACELKGGTGVLFVANTTSSAGTLSDLILDGYVEHGQTSIPAVSISWQTGKRLLKELQKQQEIQVSLTVLGEDCKREQSCSDEIPCTGKFAGNYCGIGARCNICPTLDSQGTVVDSQACFFAGEEWLLDQSDVESCAATCGGRLEFEDCKLCPQDVTGLDFGGQDDGNATTGEPCQFCPDNEPMLYPDRTVRLFSSDQDRQVTCWQLQRFFETVHIPQDSQNCRLGQALLSHSCGCGGSSYAGASTPLQRSLLIWLPRAAAIFSLLGSLFIVIDALRLRERRRRVFYQIMVFLSFFDILGAVAYGMTSLAIPASDAIEGSAGTAATCTAQGFLIQLGTVSCYANVSLAVYYYLVITGGWSERRIRRQVRLWLLACPAVVGMAFAFAGLAYYDNMILWCNNSAPWWPDIPVALAIGFATILMLLVCLDVYRKERASMRWPFNSNSSQEQPRRELTLAERVFWQSCWYLLAFYLTWPAYLALQYSWALGYAYSAYGLILAAGTMAPLQGFWNFVVYIRPRYLAASRRNRRPDRPQLQSSSRLGSLLHTRIAASWGLWTRRTTESTRDSSGPLASTLESSGAPRESITTRAGSYRDSARIRPVLVSDADQPSTIAEASSEQRGGGDSTGCFLLSSEAMTVSKSGAAARTAEESVEFEKQPAATSDSLFPKYGT